MFNNLPTELILEILQKMEIGPPAPYATRFPSPCIINL